MTHIPSIDYDWLLGDDARRWLAELADDRTPVERLVTRLRRELSLERTHLIVEQLDLRRRARAKFSQADRMFFTRQSLEQATDERLADWKAARFGPRSLIGDLCVGVGGDALSLARCAPVVAVERDPIVAKLAAANARELDRPRLRVLTADVERALDEHPAEFVAAPGTAWHVDPDRRATGTRTTHVDFCQPGPATIARWRTWSGAGAVKLAPATVVPGDWSRDCQREWVETRGECRQQLLWFGDLAQHAGRRSATIVDRGVGPRTVVERPESAEPFIVERPRRYVADPRPAVYAAGLATSLAAEQGAASLGDEHGYLTNDEPVNDAAWQQYEVLDVLPFDRRRLKEALRARTWGRVVWKSRGVDADLARLSRELAASGDSSGVVLLATFDARTWAILAAPTVAGDAPPA